MQKFVLLLVLYNGLAAALIGTLVVAGVRLLFEFGPKKTYLVNSDAFAVRVDVVLATMGGFGAAAVSLGTRFQTQGTSQGNSGSRVGLFVL